MSSYNQLVADFFSSDSTDEQVNTISSIQQEQEVEDYAETQQAEQLSDEEADLYRTHFSFDYSSFDEMIAYISSFPYRYYVIDIADGWLSLTCDACGKYFHHYAPINEAQQEELSARVNKEYLTHQELLAVAQAIIRSCIINELLESL